MTIIAKFLETFPAKCDFITNVLEKKKAVFLHDYAGLCLEMEEAELEKAKAEEGMNLFSGKSVPFQLSVSVAPGKTAVTLILFSFNSSRKTWFKPSIAYLLIQ